MRTQIYYRKEPRDIIWDRRQKGIAFGILLRLSSDQKGLAFAQLHWLLLPFENAGYRVYSFTKV
jgi:hypothetical protein